MSVGDGVAIYAALVSTVVAGFRVVEWRSSRRPTVVVEPRFAFLTMTDGSLVDSIVINVHNNGDHAIRVTSAGLTLQDGSGRTITQVKQVPGATLPGPIAPHDSAMTYFVEADLVRETGIDKFEPVEAWAVLSTGPRVQSKAKPLLKR
jgi:hypothetical protein